MWNADDHCQYIRDVRTAERPTLLRNYQAACTAARALRRTLVAAGIPPGDVRVVATLAADGGPVVVVRLTDAATRRLRHLAAASGGGGPSGGRLGRPARRAA